MVRLTNVRNLCAFLFASVFVSVWSPPRSVYAQSISSSSLHTCVTTAKGDIYCWGETHWWPNNLAPSLPDSAPLPQARIGPRARYDSIATGWLHDCALTSDGRVICKGDNGSGQLGRGGLFDQAPPRLASSLRFKSVTAGLMHTCALSTDGAAYCWGYNDAGQTGIGSRREIVMKPTAVVGGHRFRVLTAGSRHTCGITVAGRTLCWGANDRGQLGRDPDLTDCYPNKACMAVPRPLDESRQFIEIAAGYAHTCARTADFTIYCWGEEFSSYMQVGRVFAPFKLTSIKSPVPLHALSSGRMLSCGLSDDGRAYCWGPNGLGRDYVQKGCEKVDRCIDTLPIAPEIRFRSFKAGHSQSCGIGRSGAVYCVGARETRQHDSRNQPMSSAPSCFRLFVTKTAIRACSAQPFRVLVPNVITGERYARSVVTEAAVQIPQR